MLDNDFDIESFKSFYELNKVISLPQEIFRNFVSAISLALFKQYLMTFDNPDVTLKLFMEEWRSNIIKEKEGEIKALLEEEGNTSMADMVVCSTLADAINLDEFKDAVDDFIANTTKLLLNTTKD